MMDNTVIKCCICFEIPPIQKCLACLHSFCPQCLERIHHHTGQSGRLRCPLCREITTLPSGGISKLHTNLEKAHLVSIYNQLMELINNGQCDGKLAEQLFPRETSRKLRASIDSGLGDEAYPEPSAPEEESVFFLSYSVTNNISSCQCDCNSENNKIQYKPPASVPYSSRPQSPPHSSQPKSAPHPQSPAYSGSPSTYPALTSSEPSLSAPSHTVSGYSPSSRLTKLKQFFNFFKKHKSQKGQKDKEDKMNKRDKKKKRYDTGFSRMDFYRSMNTFS